MSLRTLLHSAKVVNLSRYDSVPIILHPSIDNIRFSFLLRLVRPPKIQSRPCVNAILFLTYAWYYRKSVSTKILRPITFDVSCTVELIDIIRIPLSLSLSRYIRVCVMKFLFRKFFSSILHTNVGREEGSEARFAMM